MVRASVRCSLGAFVLGLLVFWSHRSDALGAGETVDLRYEAPPSCPARTDVLRAIHARAPRGFPSADDRSFRVRIERDGESYQGRLEIERNGRVLSVREIRDATCETVTTAVAVFIAIALDPAEEPPGSDGSDEPSPPPPKFAPKPPKPPSPATEPAAPIVQRSMAGWYWGSGLDLAAVFHPSPATGARVHAEIARFASGAFLAPELRLSWGWTQLSESPPRGGEARFRFQTARAEACALFHRAAFVITPCAGFDAGVLSATTRDLPRAGGTTEPWYALVAGVRPGWFVADWLSLEADVGVLFPLTQASFVLAEPERTVYRIPRVAISATAGFRIWARLP